jgi:tRNA A-37 threonylcarbamoyl transferase component Bud32
MAEIGIPTADPVAVGEMRRCGTLCSCCIVTQEIPQTINLIEYALKEWRHLPAAQRRRAFTFIAAAVCRDLQNMHTHDFFHIDPKWRNIMIRRDEVDKSELQGIWWIDSPRGRILSGRRHDYGMIYDLANLARKSLSFLSRSQRLRFLHAYCGPLTDRKEIKRIVKKINLRLQRKPPRIYR